MTSGKWCPLASIWVPIRIRAPPRWTAARCSSSAPLRLVVSRSIREIGTSGNSGAGACSSCSVPIPTGTRCVEPQEGHWRGIGRWLSQWWQRRWCCALVQRIVTVAARAFRYPAAIVAQQRWRKAAAVKKQDHWLSACRCWRIRLISAGDRPACSGCPLRSSTCCWAGRALPARLLKVNWRYLPGGRYAESPAPASPSRELSGSARCGRAIPPGRGHGSASLPAACRSCHALRR